MDLREENPDLSLSLIDQVLTEDQGGMMMSYVKKKIAKIIRGLTSIILDEAKDTIKSTLIKRANLSSSTFIESHLSDALLFETDKQIRAFAAERALDLSSTIPSGGGQHA